jgi:hypothetical protein
MGLFDIFQNKSAEDAAAARRSGLQTGYDNAAGFYGQGRDALTTNYGAAIQPFSQLFQKGSAGTDAYSDATGVNGAEGLARAGSLFKSTPGYTEGINLALDANDRRATSRGMLNSGNTIADTTKLATDYASTHYNDYKSGLSPFLNLGTTAASGAGNLYSGLGNGLNQSYTGQGDLSYKTATGQGDATASADLNKYNVSNNMWGALMNGAKLATSAAGFLV